MAFHWRVTHKLYEVQTTHPHRRNEGGLEPRGLQPPPGRGGSMRIRTTTRRRASCSYHGRLSSIRRPSRSCEGRSRDCENKRPASWKRLGMASSKLARDPRREPLREPRRESRRRESLSASPSVELCSSQGGPPASAHPLSASPLRLFVELCDMVALCASCVSLFFDFTVTH